MSKTVLIISDIEGSSGCFSYEASTFMHEDWPAACHAMSLDVKAVTDALLEAGAEKIIVKDFHRTGYNILSEYIDPKVDVVWGYKEGPVPGIGDPEDASILMMMGMHVSSGSDGFLAHTLTSKIAKLEVNGRPVSEAELFSSSVYEYGIKPVFFSGCPAACSEVSQSIEKIKTYPIDKLNSQFDAESWRIGLGEAAVKAYKNIESSKYCLQGQLDVSITWRDGESYSAKIAKRWRLENNGATICFNADNFNTLYETLIKICYLTPFIEKILPIGLGIFSILGKYGQLWVRKKLKKKAKSV